MTEKDIDEVVDYARGCHKVQCDIDPSHKLLKPIEKLEAALKQVRGERDQALKTWRRCWDNGTCHHDCESGCWRKDHCGPLAGSLPDMVEKLEKENAELKAQMDEIETLIRLDLETEFSVEADRFDKDCKKALWRLADDLGFPWESGEEYQAIEITEWIEEVFDTNQKENAELKKRVEEPIRLRICCPICMTYHIDRGEWATQPHKTHLCDFCGNQWKPTDEFYTVGVEDDK